MDGFVGRPPRPASEVQKNSILGSFFKTMATEFPQGRPLGQPLFLTWRFHGSLPPPPLLYPVRAGLAAEARSTRGRVLRGREPAGGPAAAQGSCEGKPVSRQAAKPAKKTSLVFFAFFAPLRERFGLISICSRLPGGPPHLCQPHRPGSKVIRIEGRRQALLVFL